MARPIGSIVTGIAVKEGDYRGRTVYHLKNGGKLTNIIAPYTKFIEDGDSVSFRVDKTIKPTSGSFTNTTLYEIAECKIAINYTEEGIIDAAILALRDESMVRNFISEARDGAKEEHIDLHHYLDYHALEWSEESFYAWWLAHRVHRRLWHLGLYSSQIDELCKYYRLDVGHLYDRLVKNPLHAAPLEQNYALVLCGKFGIKTTIEDKTIGAIARYIYKDVNKNRNTFITQVALEKAWPIAVRYIVQLERDYEVVRYSFTNAVNITKNIVQFQYVLETEMYIADFVEEMLDKPKRFVEEIECDDDVEKDEYQYAALVGGFAHRICIWTGGPGRGKTRLIREAVRNHRLRNDHCVLTAFTGKAVARMREVVLADSDIPKDAVTIATIHSLIQKAGGMYSGKKCNIQLGHVIIDEGSMLASSLFSEFIHIYRDSIKSLIIVGDPNQLQPLEWGSCMHHLIKSDAIPVYTLQHNYRFVNDVYCLDENGFIAQTPHCKHITGSIDALMIEYKEVLTREVDYKRIIILTPTNNAADMINELCQAYRIELLEQRILTDDRKGNNKVDVIESVTDGSGRKFIVGDQIILKKNLKEGRQCNGDIGVVSRVSRPGRMVYIKFDNREEPFSLATDANEKDYSHYSRSGSIPTTAYIKLAYCLNVDNSQGSEWDNVIFYVPDGEPHVDFFNFYRINTAVSRARKYAALVGDISQIQKYFKLVPKPRMDTLASRIRSLHSVVALDGLHNIDTPSHTDNQ